MSPPKKLTIIKVMGAFGYVTSEELEKWRGIFSAHEVSKAQLAQAEADGKISIQEITIPETDDQNHYITLVKVGDTDFMPTYQDLEAWREVFEEAKDDPDFKIFTHPSVEIEVVHIGDIVAVE